MDGWKQTGAWLLTVWVVASVAVINGGCDTLSSDFAEFRQDLFPPSPTEAAEWMFDPYNAEARRRGTTLIANSPFGGAEVYVKAYADRLDPTHVDRETNPVVIASLLRALARYGEPVHAPMIASYLTDKAQQVRWEAAKGLQRIHNPQVVPNLLARLRDEGEDRDVRTACALALAQYPEDRVFQQLVGDGGLDARELAINVASLESLQTLTGQEFGLNPSAWYGWYNSAAAPFESRQEFLYPTYSRKETWFEKLAFWTHKVWEVPRQPAGLRPEGDRTTYPEGDGSGDLSEGQG